MNKVYIKQLFIVLSLSALVACAGSGEPRDDANLAGTSTGRDCISQSSIRDYQVLDDSNLILTAGVKRKYHMKLSRRAYGLRSSWKIAFRSPSGRVCGGMSDIIFEDGFDTYDQIRVDSIRELSPEEADDLLIQFGKKKADTKQDLATEEIDGAEVEELD
jgi:hypothetical protein